jgi:uncharacterized protein YndB with AHSA1/START domain
MDAHTLIFNRTINAPPTEAYRAFTRPIALREWMCDGAVCLARPAGHFHFWWNSGYSASGEFISLTADREVQWMWQGRGEPGPTRVHVALTPTDAGVAVTLAHSGLGEGEAWRKTRDEASAGWTSSLENLQSVLETGLDLRVTRRPMLGVLLGEFNATVAARLAVPVTEGFRLAGLVEGMGAATAGLRPDDVIVGVGGHATPDWPALTTALGGRQAGDVVEVLFYRGAERLTLPLRLSPRPLPQVPPTASGLAEQLRKAHTAAQAKIAACFVGATAAQATRRPAPNEWSAIETVAHLIAAEREQQAWITDLINDDERWADRFENPTNVMARVTAITAQHPTPAAILAELRRSQAEVTDMIAALPAEFMAHRASYGRLGRDLLQAIEHVHEHLAQIQGALQAGAK